MWLVLAQLSEKQLDATIRELENQNFCLNLDEGAVSMVLLREDREQKLLGSGMVEAWFGQ